ncbi:hypothetical protein ZEAMMB73_Zm00001d035406 [Zea mays]|jgi:hypothetical protein|uniref:Uncharacterized protein n=1 Tax=Zea mays TaxID=4577 RepID=A0A1D6LGA8_MAIZE|nr:hypothetical protein ZEAMMB73_Zm00001d035406 [Zea mays]
MSPHRPRPQRPHPRPPETWIQPPSSAPPPPPARDLDPRRRRVDASLSCCPPYPTPTTAPNLPSALDLPSGEGSALGSDAWVPVSEVSTGYFIGGDRIFGPDPSSQPCSFSLLPSSVARTTNASLLHVSATLTISSERLPFRDRGGKERRHLELHDQWPHAVGTLRGGAEGFR